MLISSPKLKEQIYRIKQLKGNIDNYDLSVIYKEVLGYIDYLCESTDSTELNPKVITKLEELYMRLKSSAESVSKVAHRLQEMKWSLANEECRTDIFLRVLEMVGNFFDNYIMEHKRDEENLLRAIKYLSSAVCKYK